MATSSPIFSLSRVKAFSHRGSFIPYTGKNKDLAIIKYCSTGFLDQDDRFHCIVDDMRAGRDKRGEEPMHSDRHMMVVFITSDRASGMNEALRFIMSESTGYRSNFLCIQTDKGLTQGDQRMTKAGKILGSIFKERFIEIESRGVLLDLKTHNPLFPS